jgi:hypothetical protein
VLQVMKTLVPLMLMLTALSVSAQMGNVTEPSELIDIDRVQIVTTGGRRANCIAPLAVNRVDGEMVTVPAQGFLIEPGSHTINGQATLDFSKCPHDLSDLHMGSVADLEVDFVNGFTYYVGFDYKSDNTAQWQLVVWKMEQD